MKLTKHHLICAGCVLLGLSLGAVITGNMDTVNSVLHAVGIQ